MTKNLYAGNKILLVEDEESLAVGLEYNLTEEGYKVTWANDGKKALDFFKITEFDLIILDIMLPYYDGFEVAKQIREKSPEIPILMLTARTHVDDKVHGLAIGADDYMTKPFHLQELLLRVKGMLKRKMWYKEVTTSQPIFRFGENEINFESLQATAKGQVFLLTAHEAMVLKYLIQNKGKIISRKELLEKVWNITSEIETRTVDNFIVRLRKYFEPDPAKPVFIKSIRSAGYMFNDAT
ncbi:response regulator transcription factor [candidate division KSB1 bacterium]|nr:response regulator transcription factor [candidate division KSB1 bacterium]